MHVPQCCRVAILKTQIVNLCFSASILEWEYLSDCVVFLSFPTFTFLAKYDLLSNTFFKSDIEEQDI